MLKIPPLSLYIHYPWCLKKCPYCDFNSHEGDIHTGYINLLLTDLDNDLKYVQNREIRSIFIGGGTPSLMSPVQLESLIKELDENNIACRPLISGSMGTQPFYKKLYGENKLPKCSIIDERGVYVPNHDKMTKEDIDRVCDILLKY